jgi:hypothetical protein
VAALARHLHTPVGDVEEVDWDRFEAYIAALNRILKIEQNGRGRQ